MVASGSTKAKVTKKCDQVLQNAYFRMEVSHTPTSRQNPGKKSIALYTVGTAHIIYIVGATRLRRMLDEIYWRAAIPNPVSSEDSYAELEAFAFEVCVDWFH